MNLTRKDLLILKELVLTRLNNEIVSAPPRDLGKKLEILFIELDEIFNFFMRGLDDESKM